MVTTLPEMPRNTPRPDPTPDLAAAKNPGAWIGVADRLKRSAEVLMDAHHATWSRLLEAQGGRPFTAAYAASDQSDLISQTFWHNAASVMLSGFALENLLKGILVTRDPTRVGSAEKLFNWDHDLIRLSADAKVALTPAQKRVMGRLTDYTTWAGRYPVANKAAGMAPRQNAPTGGATWDGNDNAIVDDLYESLRKMLEDELREPDAAL